MSVKPSKRYPGKLLSVYHNQKILEYIILHRILYCSSKQLGSYAYHSERGQQKQNADLIANVCQI